MVKNEVYGGLGTRLLSRITVQPAGIEIKEPVRRIPEARIEKCGVRELLFVRDDETCQVLFRRPVEYQQLRVGKQAFRRDFRAGRSRIMKAFLVCSNDTTILYSGPRQDRILFYDQVSFAVPWMWVPCLAAEYL